MYPKELENLERKYASLVSKYTKYKTNKNRNGYLTSKRKAQNIKFEIYSILVPLLEGSNPYFKALSDRNRSILSSKELKLKAHKYGLSGNGEYARSFVGRIMSNGLIYAGAVDVGGATIFQKMAIRGRYVTKFKGRINCLGFIEIFEEKVQSMAVNSLPTHYSALISSDGSVQVFTTDTKKDVRGLQMVEEIIGNPFIDNQQKMEFFKNRSKLIQIIESYRMKYLK